MTPLEVKRIREEFVFGMTILGNLPEDEEFSNNLMHIFFEDHGYDKFITEYIILIIRIYYVVKNDVNWLRKIISFLMNKISSIKPSDDYFTKNMKYFSDKFIHVLLHSVKSNLFYLYRNTDLILNTKISIDENLFNENIYEIMGHFLFYYLVPE